MCFIYHPSEHASNPTLYARVTDHQQYKSLRTAVFTRGKAIRLPHASDSAIFLNLMIADLIQAVGEPVYCYAYPITYE